MDLLGMSILFLVTLTLKIIERDIRQRRDADPPGMPHTCQDCALRWGPATRHDADRWN